MIHVCIAEPALIDSIVLTAVVRLDLMALAAKMYQVRLTQLFNKYRGKTMEQLQRFHALIYIKKFFKYSVIINLLQIEN